MSQYYDMGEETLWNPSLNASRLFLRQVALFEAELGMPSGIGPMESDECRIDPAPFASFVGALLAWRHATSHAVMIALSEGFLATLLVLTERTGTELEWPSCDRVVDEGSARGEDAVRNVQAPAAHPAPGHEEWAAELRDRARELGRSMAR